MTIVPPFGNNALLRSWMKSHCNMVFGGAMMTTRVGVLTLCCAFSAYSHLAIAQVAIPSLPEVKAELRRMVSEGRADLWQHRLAPDFKSGFGEDGEGQVAKNEFISKITGDLDFKAEFLRILSTDCVGDRSGVDICPVEWTNCAEADLDCGTQRRIAIDRTSHEWIILYYIEGD
jgi:hypothetical protein